MLFLRKISERRGNILMEEVALYFLSIESPRIQAPVSTARNGCNISVVQTLRILQEINAAYLTGRQ